MRIHRTGIRLGPDCSRVLLRPFDPQPIERFPRILGCILSLSEEEVQGILNDVLARFQGRHRRLSDFLLGRYANLKSRIPEHESEITARRKLLIGAYFTLEYSFECAALFNPSIVWHADQTGLADGTRRFILSIRCTGEGHISSLGFRTGTIDGRNAIKMDQHGPYAEVGKLVPDAFYERDLFIRKLTEIRAYTHVAKEVLAGIPERFTIRELEARLSAVSLTYGSIETREHEFTPMASHIMALAQSNYTVNFSADQPLSERIIFPSAPSELNGIEDARFVRFVDDDGSMHYFATYTAYSGATVPRFRTRELRCFHARSTACTRCFHGRATRTSISCSRNIPISGTPGRKLLRR